MTALRRLWRAPRWGGRVLAAVAAALSLVAALAIVLASSAPPRLSARGTPLPLPSTPSPAASTATPVPEAAPVPAAAAASTTTLTSVGTDELVALTSTGAAVSTLGRAWTPIPVPAGTSGVVVDHADGDALLVGGSRVQTTSDGGRHWAATPAQPAPSGPFVPLLISPWDPHVLFVSHQDQVAVTTDGGGTWHDVGVPVAGRPVMASGNSSGIFFVSAGGHTFQLTDDGAKINPRPALPPGVNATSLAVGRYLLVAGASNHQMLILKGTHWAVAPITAEGPVAVDGTDIWAAVSASGASAPEAVKESSDGGATWQVRPGLPAGLDVLSLALSGDGHTVYALTSAGEVYEAQNGIWYLLSSGLQFASPPA